MVFHQQVGRVIQDVLLKNRGLLAPFSSWFSSLVKRRHFYLTSHINTNPLHKYNWSTGLSKGYIASPLTEWAINSIEFQHIRHNIRQRLLILILNPIAPFSFLKVWFWCLCCCYILWWFNYSCGNKYTYELQPLFPA